MMQTNPGFQKGEPLLVRPLGPDDPDALLHAGKTCYFDRYGSGYAGQLFVFVYFQEKGKRYCFRAKDLVKQEGQSA